MTYYKFRRPFILKQLSLPRLFIILSLQINERKNNKLLPFTSLLFIWCREISRNLYPSLRSLSLVYFGFCGCWCVIYISLQSLLLEQARKNLRFWIKFASLFLYSFNYLSIRARNYKKQKKWLLAGAELTRPALNSARKKRPWPFIIHSFSRLLSLKHFSFTFPFLCTSICSLVLREMRLQEANWGQKREHSRGLQIYRGEFLSFSFCHAIFL